MQWEEWLHNGSNGIKRYFPRLQWEEWLHNGSNGIKRYFSKLQFHAFTFSQYLGLHALFCCYARRWQSVTSWLTRRYRSRWCWRSKCCKLLNYVLQTQTRLTTLLCLPKAGEQHRKWSASPCTVSPCYRLTVYKVGDNDLWSSVYSKLLTVIY